MEYKGVILTNHLLSRMKERGISYKDLYWVFSNPDEVLPAKVSGGKKFYRNYKGQRWSVVAKKNEEGKWILLTCWVKDFNKSNYRSHGKENKRQSSFWRILIRMIVGK